MADQAPKSRRTIVILGVVAVAAVVVMLLWLCDCFGDSKKRPVKAEGKGRVATIIAVNDIYRIDGVGEKEDGGLHRLRTLRKTIEKESGKVLLLHAGDFLSPALEGRVFKGEQMIDAMNNLDGDPKKFDARMFVAFGNHEFDDSLCNRPPAPLNARINESQFTWLNANLDFSSCQSMKDVPAHKNVKRTAIVEMSGIKVGLFGIGLTPDPKDATRYPKFGDIYEAARGAIKELKDKKADVVVALTHLDRDDDEVLLRSLSEYGLDLIVGGHEHEALTIDDAHNVTRGFKADSDGKSARRIDIALPAKGRATFRQELLLLNEGTYERDKDMAKLAKKWAEMAEAKICAERKKAGREPYKDKCLQEPAGAARFAIALEEADNRNKETEFGHWIAEAVRKATGADVAIVGAGSLGLNTNLAAGAMLRLEQVVDIFRFDDIVAVREVSQKVVCEALRHGFARPGSGAWPHVSGVKAAGNAATPEEILKKWQGEITRDNGTPFDCSEKDSSGKEMKVKVAGAPYTLCGGDSYPPMVNKGEEGDKCVDTLRRNPKDKPKYPQGRYISAIAEQTIRHDKGLVMPPDPGE